MKLTRATVEKLVLPPGKSELLVFDDDLPGFGLRIRAGGKRTWVAQYRLGKKQRRITLGTDKTLALEQARKRAREALAKVHLGTDPQLEKTESKSQAELTFERVVDEFIARYAVRKLRASSLADVQRYLRVHWATLRGKPISKIHRADVAAGLTRIGEVHGLYAANRARAALSSFFAWAIGEGLLEINPVVGTIKPAQEKARQRVLSDAEIRAIWNSAGPGDFGDIVKLLILTGQRREEVAAMRWSELKLEDRTWRFTAERSKNGVAQEVYLTDLSLAILQDRTRRPDRDLVFGSRGPFSGFSNAKDSLDKRLLVNIPTLADDPWRIHDIRRSISTRMGDLGVAPHVVDMLLNHVSGYRAGVSGVYNRSSYAADKKSALIMWTDYLVKLLGV